MAGKVEEELQEHEKGSVEQLVDSSDVKPGRHLHLIPTSAAAQPQNPSFCDFVETASEQLVVEFFRQVIREIEQTRQISDYHFKLKPSSRSKPGGFEIEIFYGESRGGPEKVEPDACISCRDKAPLFPGAADSVLAGECVLREFSDQPYVQCSVDAKARPGFIVTPCRHVECLADLEDAELYSMWSVAVRALRNEGLNFTSMIVNHGSYRNLPHLHLKIWVDDGQHRQAMTRWSPDKKKLWARLERLTSGLPKKRALCVAVERGWKCKFGDRCRFSHQ